jgi:hypothetical protein
MLPAPSCVCVCPRPRAERLTKIVRVALHCKRMARKLVAQRAAVAKAAKEVPGASFSAHAVHSALVAGGDESDPTCDIGSFSGSDDQGCGSSAEGDQELE